MEEKGLSRANKSEGTLIRGADGNIYFIPDDKLEAFKVPERRAKVAEKLFFSEDNLNLVANVRGDVVKDKLGLVAADTTTINVVNLGSIRQLKK